VVGVVWYLNLLFESLLDGLKAGIFVGLFEQTWVQLGYYAFGQLLVWIQVGRVGPPDQEIMRQGLTGNLFAEVLKKLIILETHDESKSEEAGTWSWGCNEWKLLSRGRRGGWAEARYILNQNAICRDSSQRSMGSSARTLSFACLTWMRVLLRRIGCLPTGCCRALAFFK